MSFMLKIAFALQVTVLGAAALAATNTNPTPTATHQVDSTPAATDHVDSTAADQDVTPDRPTCDACADGYNECLSEGISPDACRRAYANCFRNCL